MIFQVMKIKQKQQGRSLVIGIALVCSTALNPEIENPPDLCYHESGLRDLGLVGVDCIRAFEAKNDVRFMFDLIPVNVTNNGNDD